MNLSNDLIRHRPEFLRAIRNKHYEEGPSGILFPRMGAIVAGVFTTWVNGEDMAVDPNIVPAEGLAQILKSGVGGTAAYIAPFLTNANPASNLTAATFDSTLNEFTAYDEANRVAWTIPADPVAGAYTNSASPAVLTSSTGVSNVSVHGAGLLTAAAKGATTGKIICASKFDNAKVLSTPDKLTIQYDLTATSA